MQVFFRLCREWYKRFFTRRTIIFFSIIAVVALYCGNRGGAEFNRHTRESLNFSEKEASIFKTIRNYDEYSNTGVGFYVAPDVQSVFFNPPPIMYQLTAQVNTIARLTVNDGLDRFRISGRPRFRFRFSAAVCILLSAFALLLGFMPFGEGQREYLKFLSGRYSRAMVFNSLFAAMLFVAVVGLFFMMAGAALGIMSQGISLIQINFLHVLAYVFVTILMLSFFCLSGAIAGLARSKIAGYIALPTVWFLLIFGIPGIVDSTFEEKGTDVPSKKELYERKLLLINEFEKMVEEKEGKFDKNNMEKEKKIAEFYLKKIFPAVEQLDRYRRNTISSEVSLYNNIRMFTVTGFYDSVGDGLGGRGYEQYVEFLDFLLPKRREFVNFWVDHVYHKKTKKVMAFLKGNDIFYHPVNRGPGNMAYGFIFNLIVVLIMNAVAYRRFKSYIHTLETEETGSKENPVINVAKSELKTLWISKPREVCDKLYNILSGQTACNHKEKPIRIAVDNVDLSANRKKIDFLYIFHPRFLPGNMRVKDFLAFSLRGTGVTKKEKKTLYTTLAPLIAQKTFENLDLRQKGEVLLAVLPYFKHRVFLVDNIDTASGMSVDFLFQLNDIMKQWAASGASVIHLTTERVVESEAVRSRRGPTVDFDEHSEWSAMVTRLKQLEGDKKSA